MDGSRCETRLAASSRQRIAARGPTVVRSLFGPTVYDAVVHRPIRRMTGRALLAALAICMPLACGPTLPVTSSPTGTLAAPSDPTATSAGSPTAAPTEPSAGLARWSAISPSGLTPAPRADQSWTVDPSSAVAYLFAGRGDGSDLDDLWAYDLTADVWERLEPAGDRPAPRHDHVAAWIEGLGLVVFGGRTDSGALDDFWAYDPGVNAWRTLGVAGSRPGPRTGACVALRADGRLWLLGGQSADGSVLADAWVYDPGASTWTERPAPGEAPAGRSGAACWWSADDRFVVYGGTSVTGAALGDAWSLAAAESPDADWQRLADSGLTPRSGAAGTAVSGGAVVAGGIGGDGALRSDVVIVDPRTLAVTRLEAAPDGPPARSSASLIDDPGGERLVLFGGAATSGMLGDLWALDLP